MFRFNTFISLHISLAFWVLFQGGVLREIIKDGVEPFFLFTFFVNHPKHRKFSLVVQYF